MTYERAFAIWRGNSMATASEYLEMTDLVSKAILKQIPKKPDAQVLVKAGALKGKEGECAECGTHLYYRDRFCPYCGQAIDWSDE